MRHSSTLALTAVVVLVAGCGVNGDAVVDEFDPASSPSPQCSEETTYDYEGDAVGEPTPLEAFEVVLMLGDLPALADDQVASMREQLAEVPADEDAGVVVVGAEGATVTIRPLGGSGWGVGETTTLADC